jgi:phage pi2 protein 07
MTFEEWFEQEKQRFSTNTNGEFSYTSEDEDEFRRVWEAAQPKWLPISEAPEFKDVLVMEVTGHVYIAERQGNRWWQSVESADIRVRPVKWMPIPE